MTLMTLMNFEISLQNFPMIIYLWSNNFSSNMICAIKQSWIIKKLIWKMCAEKCIFKSAMSMVVCNCIFCSLLVLFYLI